MDKIIEIANEIGDKVLELLEAKEYLRLKNLVDKNEEIQVLQKAIIEKQNKGENEEADNLLSRLNSIPLIINFKLVQEELANSLRQISEILK